MKSTLSIPNIAPDDIEETIEQLRQLVHGVGSWFYINGILHVRIERADVKIKGKIIVRIVYRDAKSWVADYHRDFNERGDFWYLVGCRGDWEERLNAETD